MPNNRRQTYRKTGNRNNEEVYSSIVMNGIMNPFLIYKKLCTFMFLVSVISFGACKEDSAKMETIQSASQELSSPTEEVKDEKKVILFYGNSLTAGYGLDENESFPSRIEDRIDSLGLDYSVVNAGLSGETTSGGLKRIDWVMKQKVDVFILELGANDMLRGLPLDQTRQNLLEIISIVKAKNPQVKIGLCEMMAPPNMGEEYVNEFTKIYRDLSASSEVQFIPFFLDGVATNEDLLLKDGKHPNAQGQIIVAENIWKTLKEML